MKIKDIVTILKTKDQKAEVNYIVVETSGNIVSIYLDGDRFDVPKICRAFMPKGGVYEKSEG